MKGARVIVSGRLEQHSWETEAGERRSRVEVTADEVGPSLRFATAEISHAERHTPDHADPSDSDQLADTEVAETNA